MWPYDCFNEYSALMNEFNVDDNGDKRRKVFVAKDYGNTEREEIIIEAIRKAIPGVEVIDRDSRKIEEDIVRYGLIESMPKKTKKGDINLDILIKIIQSRLFIADITPVILRTVIKKKKREEIIEKEIVNNNVIFELGLALAWKIPEQVVIIYDAKFDLRRHRLPFDIQGYFCREVSFENEDKPIEKIRKSIKEHLEDIESKKNIIIKNILTKIDAVSLQLLLQTQGRPFQQNIYDLGTIRHLMGLSIINIERYPLKKLDGTIDHICYFTELGRFLLKKGLGVKPADKLFADVVLLCYWEGYKRTDAEAYARKHKSFKLEHGVTWTKCNKSLVQAFHQKGIRRGSDIIQLYEDYFRIPKKSFEVFTKDIIKPWLVQIKQYKS